MNLLTYEMSEILKGCDVCCLLSEVIILSLGWSEKKTQF